MNRIENKAKKLLLENNITEPPVPVEMIAMNIGAKILLEPFEGDDDISGMLYRDGQHTIIGINSAHFPTRQRFSIAHEIGHFVLHKKQLFIDKVIRVDFRNSLSSQALNKEEIAANAFAAELLMPRDLIIQELKRLFSNKNYSPSKDELIKDLADIFNVSQQAMEYRLNNLGILTSQ
jgi:Zn-dependent peptidase ImmA (M78 family)